MSKLLYFITPKELSSKLQSLSKAIVSVAILEQYICEKSQHKPTYLPHYSKFTKQNEIIWVSKGEYFTSYAGLASNVGLSIKQVRNRLKKLIVSGLIEVENIKDGYRFDLGIKIKYLPIFNMFKQGNRRKSYNKDKKLPNDRKRATINNKVLSKDKQTAVSFSYYSEKTVARLEKLGLNNKTLTKFITKYREEEVVNYLKLLELSKNVTNPVAWLQSALHQQFDLSKVDFWKENETKSDENQKNRYTEHQKQEELEIQKELDRKVHLELVQSWRLQNQAQYEQLVKSTQHHLKNSNTVIYTYLLAKAHKEQVEFSQFLSQNTFFINLVNTNIIDIIDIKTPTLT